MTAVLNALIVRPVLDASFEARLRLGEALMMRGQNAEAVVLLLPVSNSPHRSTYTRRAREMIAAARQAMGLAVETFEAPPEEQAEPSGEGAPAEAGDPA